MEGGCRVGPCRPSSGTTAVSACYLQFTPTWAAAPRSPRISGGFHLSLAVQTTDEPGQMLRNSFVQYGRVEAPQHHADRIDHHARIGVRGARSARRDNLHGWLPLRI